MAIDTDQFSVLRDGIHNLQKSVDILADDRTVDLRKVEDLKEELQEVRMRLGAMEGQLDELRKIVNDMPRQTQNQVANAVQPMMQEAQGLTEAINSATIIKVKTKGFWRRLFRR